MLQYNHDRYLDAETGAFPSKPLPHLPQPFYVFEEILALVNGPLPALSLGEDKSEEAISRRPFGEKWRAKVRAVSNLHFVWAWFLLRRQQRRRKGTLSLAEQYGRRRLGTLNADLSLFVQQPTYDLSPIKDDIPTLQRAHAVLAWLVHFYVHSTPPPPNKEIIVPASIARPLVRE